MSKEISASLGYFSPLGNANHLVPSFMAAISFCSIFSGLILESLKRDDGVLPRRQCSRLRGVSVRIMEASCEGVLTSTTFLLCEAIPMVMVQQTGNCDDDTAAKNRKIGPQNWHYRTSSGY